MQMANSIDESLRILRFEGIYYCFSYTISSASI